MPHFPEQLYQLSQRDLQVTWLDPAIFQNIDILAAVSVNTTLFTVPEGRVLLLQSVSAIADPGAAQSCRSVSISLLQPVSATLFPLARETFAVAADQDRVANWSGSIMVPPGYGINALATFDAAVAANSIRGDMVGLLIPLANVQRV